jgi:hypothetical protein
VKEGEEIRWRGGRRGGEKVEKWKIIRVEKLKRRKGEGEEVEKDEGKRVEYWESEFFEIFKYDFFASKSTTSKNSIFLFDLSKYKKTLNS